MVAGPEGFARNCRFGDSLENSRRLRLDLSFAASAPMEAEILRGNEIPQASREIAKALGQETEQCRLCCDRARTRNATNIAMSGLVARS